MRISDIIDPGNPGAIEQRRSIEEAVADLLAKYQRRPSAELARMIEQLQAEIADRKRPS